MFRFNPEITGEGKFVIDSKAPTADYRQFIESEVRYARLLQSFPEKANELFNKADETAKARYEKLVKLQKLYNED